ncbi:MAG TPA: hypothetical protein VK586_24610 [Streptosporangiaceae bacterium]|nr:hypothetical protein [Streptosporangiaceae bacterium]
MSSCAPSYSTGPNAWDAPIGYAEDIYWNNSSASLTIEPVSLIDPHNLVLHGSVRSLRRTGVPGSASPGR